MRLPSNKALCAAFGIEPMTATVIRGILYGAVDPCEVSQAAKRYRDACYHPPGSHLLKLEAVNDLIDGSGVEYIGPGTNQRSPGFYYINLGDTYTLTLLRTGKDRYRLGSWGDIVERGNYR